MNARNEDITGGVPLDFDRGEFMQYAAMPPKAPAVYRAIAAVTGKLAKVGIAKDKKNDQQGYKFRGIDDVYNALSAFISEAGLCILPRVLSRQVTERASRNGGVLFYTVLDVEFDFVAAEDGSRHTVRMPGEAMDSGDKSTNKAMSAAYKYACIQAFCIPTAGDNDADKTTHDVAHDPGGELGQNVPTHRAVDLAEAMREILSSDLTESDMAASAYAIHLTVMADHDLYKAAADHLHTRERNGWHKLVGIHKKALQAKASIDPLPGEKEPAAAFANGRA